MTFALVLLAGSVAEAQPDRRALLERVVATVDGEPIFLSEVRWRATRFGRRGSSDRVSQDRLDSALESLLLERAYDRLVEREGIVVSDETVYWTIRTTMRLTELSPSEFWLAVARYGHADPSQYREEVRAAYARALLRTRFEGDLDAEVAAERARMDVQLRGSEGCCGVWR